MLGKESKVHGWIAQLGSLTDQEVAIVGAMTFSKVQDLSADVTEGFGQQAAGISDIKATMTAMASNDSSKKRDEMLRCALEPEDQNAKRFGKLVDEILPNSGSWIVSEPEFVKCVERKQPVLFICGGPGAGKSFLSCSIIQYLRDQFPQGVGDSSRQSICYFFCKADTPKLKDLNVLLRTVAYQITKNDETFAKYAVSYCNPSVNFFSSREVWRKLFTGFYTGDKKSAVTIVVDGLDECDDEQREMFLDYLAALQEEADESENFKITTILVGRDDLLDEFDAAFNAPVPTIRVSPDKIGKDLESFSKKSLKKVRVARKFKASSQKKIIAQLMQKAAGNFEWVRQAVEELKNQDDEHQITRALEKMPSGLDQMLIYTIERFSKTLSDDKIEDLNTMLFWVACSVDAISLFDLNLILGLSRPGEDGYTDLADVIASRYGSFFTLFLVGEHRGSNKNIQDEESRNRQIRQRLLYLAGDHERDEDAAKKAEAARDLDTPESSDLDDTSEDESDETEVDLKSFVVRFSHTSIREFFLGQFQIPASKIRVEQTGAALKIAKAYLCLIVADDETWDRAWIQNQLALNAAVNVWDVLQRVDIAKTPNEDKVYIAKTLIRMFQEEKILKRWVGADGKIRERWLYSTDLMELIKSWVHDEDVSKVLSTAEASFVDAVDKSARDALVKPEALLFAREWLQGTYWANVSCFKFIHDYLRLVSTHFKELSSRTLPLLRHPMRPYQFFK